VISEDLLLPAAAAGSVVSEARRETGSPAGDAAGVAALVPFALAALSGLIFAAAGGWMVCEFARASGPFGGQLRPSLDWTISQQS